MLSLFITGFLSDSSLLKHKAPLDDVGDVKRPCKVIPVELNESLRNASEKIRKAWKDIEEIRLDAIQLRNYPFQVGTISNVLASGDVIQRLVDEMAEEVFWTRRQTDFLQLNQSCDLISVSSPQLTHFYEFLKTDMMNWMREITGMNLTHVSANCSMYNHGDHLLVHDDCIADRKIAFVFYLSPWEGRTTWTEEMGGALELFGLKEGEKEPKFPTFEKIFPENNQMVFFKVCDKSFHQVGEVTAMDYPRLTINGWFHGPGDEFESQVKENALLQLLQRPNELPFNLSEWVNAAYLKETNMASIQAEIEEDSQISLRQFLIEDFVQLIVQQLASDKELKWERSYSACERNYENLVWPSNQGPLRDLKNLFESSEFFNLLHKYTELDLSGEHAQEPKCFVELQRWTNECYTMLVNETKESYVGNLLDVIFYLNANEKVSVGTFVYTNQSEEDGAEKDDEDSDDNSENDAPLLSVEPEANSLNIVYCNEGVTKFGKYVSKAVQMNGEYVYILSCTYKE